MISIRCLLFGHKEFTLDAFRGKGVLQTKSPLGDPLVTIKICRRCDAVYWEPLGGKQPDQGKRPK